MRELFLKIEHDKVKVRFLPSIRTLRAILCVTVFLGRHYTNSAFFRDLRLPPGVKLSVRPSGWIVQG